MSRRVRPPDRARIQESSRGEREPMSRMPMSRHDPAVVVALTFGDSLGSWGCYDGFDGAWERDCTLYLTNNKL
jgi:hypothetical protein